MGYSVIVFFTLIAVVSTQNITRPASTSSDRDSFQNPKCNWQACLKYASTCHTASCCSCMCNTGTSYMSLNKSCVAEKQIATGCNFMAQTSSTAPWSFRQISVATISELVTGIHAFHCTLSSCVMATDCKLMDLQYENNGWKKFPTSMLGTLSFSQNLLKLSGNKCYLEVYQGLLLSATLQCTVKGSTTTTKSSCIILKVSGNYKVGTIPDSSNCKENSSSSALTITPFSSKQITSLLPSTTQINLVDQKTATSSFPMATAASEILTPTLSKYISPTSSVITSSSVLSSSTKANYLTSPITQLLYQTTTTRLQSNLGIFITSKYYVSVTSLSDVRVTSKPAVNVMSSAARCITSMSYVNIISQSQLLLSSSQQLPLEPKKSIQTSMTVLRLSSHEVTTQEAMNFSSQVQGITSIFPSSTSAQMQKQSSIIIGPRTTTDQNNTDKFNFVLYSSLAGGTVLFILIVLGIFLTVVLIKRKRLKIQRNNRKVIVRKFSDGLATFKKRPFHGSPPMRPPPAPSIIQLGSIHRQRNFDIHMGTSDRLNLAYSWNSKQEEDFDDDDYDIPADPPGIERSFSSLYAKVDKSIRRFPVDPDEEYTSNSGDVSPKTDHSRVSFDNVYDEPGSMLGPGAEDDVFEGEATEAPPQRENDDFEKYLRIVAE